MRQEILQRLSDIEAKYDVKILLAVESGSRAWGFESKDSDYDVRFIYVHRKDWYLSLIEGRDVIEELDPDGVLDLAGWDLKKALLLMGKGIIHGIRSQNHLDEAASAYKNIDEIMANQQDLVKIITRLSPIAVVKVF